MNRIATIVFLVAAAVMTASSATAQHNLIEANVPFNFTVNNTSLPAGSYTFGFDSMYPGLLVIRDRTKSARARVIGRSGSVDRGTNDMLIFHRYYGQYFLGEVRFESASNGILLPATKIERQVGRVNHNPDLALVAAH